MGTVRLDRQAHDLYGCEGKKQRIEAIQSAVLLCGFGRNCLLIALRDFYAAQQLKGKGQDRKKSRTTEQIGVRERVCVWLGKSEFKHL